jgi:hypothetical protein
MGIGQRYEDNAKVAVAKLVDEPVLGIAFANRSGAMGALVAGEVVGLAQAGLGGGATTGGRMAPRGSIGREGDKKTRLPLNFLVAITPTRVHVYKHKMFWGSVKIKGELGVFERAGLEVEVKDGRLTKQFHLHSPAQEQTMSFEITRSKVATATAELLGAPAGG